MTIIVSKILSLMVMHFPSSTLVVFWVGTHKIVILTIISDGFTLIARKFEIVWVVRTVIVFEPRIHARPSHVLQAKVFLGASKKRQHIRMEFIPEVLFSTWRSICCAVLENPFNDRC